MLLSPVALDRTSIAHRIARLVRKSVDAILCALRSAITVAHVTVLRLVVRQIA